MLTPAAALYLPGSRETLLHTSVLGLFPGLHRRLVHTTYFKQKPLPPPALPQRRQGGEDSEKALHSDCK
jgi:hypothetical protein